MKKILLSLFIIQLFLVAGCTKSTDKETGENNLQTKELPRIAISGLSIESSTFSPALTQLEAFQVNKGDDIFELYPFLSPDSLIRKRA